MMKLFRPRPRSAGCGSTVRPWRPAIPALWSDELGRTAMRAIQVLVIVVLS